MLWLFAVSLLLLVLLSAFKSYEHRSGGLVLFAKARHRLDEKLVHAKGSTEKFFWGIIDGVKTALGKTLASIRHTVADWLRSVAASIDLR